MTRKSTVQRGNLPYLVMVSGVLGAMKQSELRVYLAIAAHVDSESWKSFPSIDRIATITGISGRTVQRALERLQTKGLISIRTGGGRGIPSTYTLNTNPDTLDVTLLKRNPDTIDVTVSEKNPDTKASPFLPERVTKRTLNPDTQGVTRTEEQNKSYALARRRNKSKTKNESNHQALIAHFTEQWSKLIGGGGKYPFAKGRDGKAAKSILDAVTGDLDRAKAIVDRYLTDTDDAFLAKNGRGRSLGLLASGACLTRYLADTAASQPQLRSDESITQDHPLIQDGREKWPDDVDSHPQEWWALATAVEAGDIQGNAVITSDAKSGEEFRAEYNQELARVAN